MDGKVEIKKRDRTNGTTRWSKEASAQFLKYLKRHSNGIEKPTAKGFYNTLIQRTPNLSGFTWMQMRDKLRNLKTKYKAAMDWKDQNGPSLIDEIGNENVLKDNLLKLCPEFDEMDELFRSKTNITMPDIFDCLDETTEFYTMSPTISDGISSPIAIDSALAESIAMEVVYINDKEPLALPKPELQSKHKCKDQFRTPKRRKLNSNNTLTYLANVQKSQTEYLSLKLKLDEQIHQDDVLHKNVLVEIEKEKLILDKKKADDDARLKEMQIKKKFEIERIRLQNELELKKFELELKYRSNPDP